MSHTLPALELSISRQPLRIHKSILVNFLFVTKIAKGQVILKNKVELPMSENGYKNIQKRFDGEDICNIDLN